MSEQSAWTAFEAEALPHVDRLFRLAMWLERDRAAAEDLVQETLTQALQSFHRYTPGTNCRAWLTSILQQVSTLDELDTDSIPASAGVHPLSNVMDDDVARPSLPLEAVLRNAPEQEDGQLKVPPVFEE